ncbi:MAG: phosphoribosylformylglycinamidine cyclo-ligase [Acidimicrobiales bacterium]
MKAPLTYGSSGVDLDAAREVVGRIRPIAASTATPSVLGSIGGFAALYELDLRRWRRPVLVSSTDGVGTKMAVARMAGRLDTVGVDLVAMCVDDVVCAGAEPLFLLDYLVTGRIDPDKVAAIVRGIASGCRIAGCALVGGETAEHRGEMLDDAFDLAGCAVGVVEHGGALGAHRVRRGDAILGLESPGLRSNGYTLARRALIAQGGLSLDGPAWPGAERTLGEVLLEPSVIYAPSVLGALSAVQGAVHACAHVTGGGLDENLQRVLPKTADALIETGSWRVPEIFSLIAVLGGVEEAEMARAFNLGIGMVMVVEAAQADEVASVVGSFGVGVTRIGSITEGTGRVGRI